MLPFILKMLSPSPTGLIPQLMGIATYVYAIFISHKTIILLKLLDIQILSVLNQCQITILSDG